MANRYWRGGTGTWSATNTANWSTTSGGAGGASVPTAVDDVFFDVNSNTGTGAFTVTMSNSPRVCNNITISGLDGVMTLAGTLVNLNVSGSLSFPATNLTVTYTGETTFNATTTGKTVTTNGAVFGGDVTFDGVGGGWTLGSAFSCGTRSLTVSSGTLNTSASNYAITAGTLTLTTSDATLTLNGSTVTLSSTGTPWNFVSNNPTLNEGTSQITLTGAGAAFTGGSETYYNVSFTSTTAAACLISGANTFNNLTFTAPAAAGITTITLSGNQTITGTLTCTGAAVNRRLALRSDVANVPRTVTRAVMAATSDVDFQSITMAGAAGTLSGTRLGNAGNNSNITFVAGTTKYWSLVGGGNWSDTAWATTSGGTPASTNFPLPQDNVIIENTGLNAGATITINSDWNIGSLDASTRTNAMTLASGTTTPRFIGNFAYGSGVTPSGTGTFTFASPSSATLDSGGKTFTQAVTINTVGTLQLVTNALTVSSSQTTVLTAGTLDLNNFTLTTGIFSSNNTNTRSIAFGTTGSIVLNSTTAGATVLSMPTATNFTFTGTSNISMAMTVTRNVRFGEAGATSANLMNLNITSGASTLDFGFSLGTAFFRQIDFTGSTCSVSGLKSCIGFTLASGGGAYGNFGLTTGSGTLTFNGKTVGTLTLNGSGITVKTLTDAGQCSSFQFINGTLDLAGYTLTTGSASTSSGTKNLTFNGGTLLISGSGATAWNNASPTNFTTTAGSGTGAISMTAATAKTFVGGGSTYNCALNQGGAGTLTITGANTFNNITNTNATASQITFPASTTTTVNAFTLSGSAGNLVSIRSSTPATRFTLSDASGTVSVSYLNIQDSNATGGATWLSSVSRGNVDNGNNLGWSFAPLPGNFIAFFTP